MTKTTARSERIDWPTLRGSIDLADVATRLLGNAPGRRGDRSRRLWWKCPFHEDRNPSFCVEPGKPSWKCWGCGEHGDAARLVMKSQGMTFPEALRFLAGDSSRSGTAHKAPRSPARALSADETGKSSGIPLSAAWELVEKAEHSLWRPSAYGPAALK
jgi:DNA primase